jgi:hypothetical protein
MTVPVGAAASAPNAAQIGSEDEALRQANRAINTFIDAESAAYELKGPAYYRTIGAGAAAAHEQLNGSAAALATFELSSTANKLQQHVLRLNRQVALIQDNAEQQDENRLQSTINGFYDTVYEYDSALADYAYETGFEDPDYTFDYSDAYTMAFDHIAAGYMAAVWILLGISVGSTVWAIQKPRYKDSSKLRILRLAIACTAWCGFIAIATGLGLYLFTWENSVFYDSVTAIFTTAALIGVYIYYVRSKRHLQHAAIPSVTTPPKSHA